MKLYSPENRRWWTLATVSVGTFVIMLDTTVVNVALPTIGRSLQMSISQLEWIVNAYALTFAVLMLTGGKLADLMGRRLILLVGLVFFIAASLAAGLASGPDLLIAARAVQGGAAALISPATLSIISATFAPKERGLAIGVWSSIVGVGIAIGPLVGGAITEQINWSWIFFINIPIGAVTIAAALALVDESKDTSQEQRLDPLGLVTSGAALFGLTYGLVEANTYGWGSARIVGSFILFAVGIAGFVFAEYRQRLPMLDLSLFRNRNFAGANVIGMLVGFAMFGFFFFVSIFMQNILGFSAIKAGATFLPMTALIILVPPAVGRVTDRIGARWLLSIGLTLIGISLVLFSRAGIDATFLDLLPALIVGGFGLAFSITPMTATVLGSTPIAKAGVGSGVLNSFRQTGGSLGLALMGAILTGELNGGLAEGRTRPDSFMTGFHDAVLFGAAVAFGGAIVAAAVIRKVIPAWMAGPAPGVAPVPGAPAPVGRPGAATPGRP